MLDGSYTSVGAFISYVVAFLVIIVIPLSTIIHRRRRAQRMAALARILGCTFRRRERIYGSGGRWIARWRSNIIEGVWRGQSILIYDFLELRGGEDYGIAYTVINGEKYTRWFRDYISVEKIRRVLFKDIAIKPIDENAKPTVLSWMMLVLMTVFVLTFFVYGIGIILYEIVKLSI